MESTDNHLDPDKTYAKFGIYSINLILTQNMWLLLRKELINKALFKKEINYYLDN